MKAAGVELIASTKEQVDAAKAKKAPETSKPTQGNMGQALEGAFQEMFNMGGGPNAITVKLSDPNNKIVSLEFQEASGKKIETHGTSSSTNGLTKTTTYTYNFESKLPDDARLVVYLATPKSMVVAPFSLKNVPLP